MFPSAVLERIEAGGLDYWSDSALVAGLPETERERCRVDSGQMAVLAELARRGRAPEAMFGAWVSPHEAQRRTKIAVALFDGSLPGAADALAAGTATFAHVAVLAELRDRLSVEAFADLLARTRELHPHKLRRAAQRVARPVTETAEGSTGISKTGGRWFRFSFDGHEGTVAFNGLEAVMDRQWRAAHPDRANEKLDRPDYGQRLAAAFLEMCRGSLAGQPADAASDDGADAEDAAAPVPAPTKAPQRAQPEIFIVITQEKMFGDAEAAGICTTIDGIPLPVEVVRKLLVDAKIYPVVLGGDGEILDFGRARRYFTSAQKKAAAVRDLSCQFGDCDNPIRYADYHHCIPWADGGPTDVANEAPTCNPCHDKLTNHGYRLERRNGTTYTYAPDGQLIHQRTNRWRK
ncbi:MAG: HNH endonuclease signature motif containing protein [Acidimicrobiales bacterium]